MSTHKNYLFIEGKGHIVLQLVDICDYGNIGSFEEELKLIIEKEPVHIIVNCEFLTAMSKDWHRVILSAQKTLKDSKKLIRFIQVKPAVIQSFKLAGLDTAYVVSNNMRDALADLGLVNKKMLDTEFVNPFLTATLHVLNVQASVTADAGKPFLKQDQGPFKGDISGVIGIVSDSFNGSVVISFPEKTFLSIMSGMLGEECLTLNQDIIDGAGEITNMIFGQAKIMLNEKGYGIKTALPSVVTGKDHSLSTVIKGTTVIVPFESSVGNFFVEICVS